MHFTNWYAHCHLGWPVTKLCSAEHWINVSFWAMHRTTCVKWPPMIITSVSCSTESVVSGGWVALHTATNNHNKLIDRRLDQHCLKVVQINSIWQPNQLHWKRFPGSTDQFTRCRCAMEPREVNKLVTFRITLHVSSAGWTIDSAFACNSI